MKYRSLWVLALVLIANMAVGQGPPVPPPGPEFKIEFATRVEDIHWAGGFRVPSTGRTGTPLAQFYMWVDPINVPSTWTNLTYHWEGVEIEIATWPGPGPPPPPADNLLLVSEPGTGQYIWGRAYMTGWYSTGCTVHYDTATESDLKYVIPIDPAVRRVYVLGGPLEFSVEKPTVQGHPTPPKRDAFESGPTTFSTSTMILLFSSNRTSLRWCNGLRRGRSSLSTLNQETSLTPRGN